MKFDCFSVELHRICHIRCGKGFEVICNASLVFQQGCIYFGFQLQDVVRRNAVLKAAVLKAENIGELRDSKNCDHYMTGSMHL